MAPFSLKTRIHTHQCTVTGYVFGAGTVVGLFSTPAWSALCDHLQQKRLVLTITIAGGSFASLLYLVPLTTTSFAVGASVFWWTFVSRGLYSFFMSPAIGILDSVAGVIFPCSDLSSHADVPYQHRSMLLVNIESARELTLCESPSVHSLDNKGDFGQCRLFGSIAWGVGVCVCASGSWQQFSNICPLVIFQSGHDQGLIL